MTIAPLPQLNPAELLAKGFERALATQAPLAKSNVDRLRRIHPDKSSQELIKSLDSTYLSAVTLTGCGAGAAGAVPGLAVGLAVALADLSSFTGASVFYVLSVAEVHGLHPEDIERRRALVLAVMVGDSGDSTGFDAARWVGDWLEQPIPALGGAKPADYMDTIEGQERVSRLLVQSQAGVFA